MNTNIKSEIIPDEKKYENDLRPETLSGYIGQQKIKESLSIGIEAAKKRGTPIDHLLFYGPPGLGKTTLANIISHEMGSKLYTVSGPSIEIPGEIASILVKLRTGDILFIDEIHRLRKPVEETLYSAMEDYRIDIVIGSDQQAKIEQISVKPFTLIGATTRAGLLSSPLRDRFGIVHRMQFYEPDELMLIVQNSAKKLGVEIDSDGAFEIGKRSRGTPRIANRILKRVRDFAEVKYNGKITKEITNQALKLLDIDECGLDDTDRTILLTIIHKFGGGPVGLDTLAASIGEDPGTIEDVYEPFLVKCGLINRTPRGRVVTESAYHHLHIDYLRE